MAKPLGGDVISMFINTFQGYNCYSSALGECAKDKKIPEIENIILSQWTFFFDEQQFLKNQWYTGAADGPVDVVLNKDLENFSNIYILEHLSSDSEALNESEEFLQRQGYQIVLVDFYYLNSFNWKSLSRFNVLREHDPHFIILTEINHGHVRIIDPYYHHVETLKIEDFRKARSSMTKQGKINYNSYEIAYKETKRVNVKELLYYRFDKYLKEEMYHKIEEFATVVKNQLTKSERKWSFIGYNCLNSIIYQHQNLMRIKKMFNIDIPADLENLHDKWALIRKKLFEYYSCGNTSTEEISDMIFEIADLEKNFTKEAIKKL